MGRIRSLCRLFALFNFTLFYQSLLFCLDTFKENRCRLIIRVLRDEFTMNGKVEYLLT